MGTRIAGLGAALPHEVITSDEMERRFGLAPGWIAERTGIVARRVAASEDTVVSLAMEAGRKACDSAGVEPGDLDALLVATCSPDMMLPPMAPQVASGLGISVAAVDIGAACAGSMWGLAHADALIASGSARRVLVVGSEILSRWTADSDPRTAILFGDGAGAMVVEGHDGPERIGPFAMRSDGAEPDLLDSSLETLTIRMHGLEVYRRAVEEMSGSAERAVEHAGLTLDDVDLVVAHQANARILDAIAERLGIPADRMYSNIAMYGNTSAASVPLALHDAVLEGRLTPGDRVLLVSFGAGFVWGAGLLTWSPVEVTSSDRAVVTTHV